MGAGESHSSGLEARGMVSDQAVTGDASPHEVLVQLSLSPSIVGLMRNSLYEASPVTSALLSYIIYRQCGNLPPVKGAL